MNSDDNYSEPNANNDLKIHHAQLSFDIYQGHGDYIFITYAHKDAESVFSDLEKFSELGINIFYDAGIPAGSSWVEIIEDKILNSKLFVPFLSPNVIESNFACDEISLAYRSELDMLPIYLEKTELKKGLNLALGNKQSIFKYEMTEEEYISLYKDAFKSFGLDTHLNDEKTFTLGNTTGQNSYNSTIIENLPKYYEHMGTSSALFTSRTYRPLKSRQEVYANSAPSHEYKRNPASGMSGILKLPFALLNKLVKPNKNKKDPTKNKKDYKKEYPKNKGDYIYISYSHNDIGCVIQEIERCKLEGYDVRFDKGINDSKDRHKQIELIKNCSIFIIFISKNLLNSIINSYELEIAYEYKKYIIPIFLEDIKLTPTFRFFLKNERFIAKYDLSEEQYTNTLFSMLE